MPRHWVYALDDPTALMEDYDRTLDGFSELFGWLPEERNGYVLYMQPDTYIRHGAGGIGYPQINMTVNLDDVRDGTSTHALLTNTVLQMEMHELGHAQLVSKFPGEEEALVNFPMAYVLNEKFGEPLDQAFAISITADGMNLTPDQAATHWMVTQNFREGKEMDRADASTNEMRYQHRGYAKYADLARLFGWDVIRNFYRDEVLSREYLKLPPSELPDSIDDRMAVLDKIARENQTDDKYRFSKALVNAYTVLLARQHPDLIINSITPGWIKTDMTAGSGASNTPAQGAIPPVWLCMSPDLQAVPTGRYYGSDCVRSPLHCYRGPGDEPYDGPDGMEIIVQKQLATSTSTVVDEK